MFIKTNLNFKNLVSYEKLDLTLLLIIRTIEINLTRDYTGQKLNIIK